MKLDPIRLAIRLAGNAEGLTLEEIAREFGVSRRTAERWRNEVQALFPQLEAVQDGARKRYRIPGGLHGFMQAPTYEEMAELELAVKDQVNKGNEARAELLSNLANKIRASLRAGDRFRLAPDVEVLTQAQALVQRAGPHLPSDPDTLAGLRRALMAMKCVSFDYTNREGNTLRRKVVPYGILVGKVDYLVGPDVRHERPAMWRIDRIGNLRIEDEPGSPPPDFNLQEFAARSFGVFQEDPVDIVLRFSPEAAPDADRYRFHPSQDKEMGEDGSLTVRFRAGGLRELAHHLFTWGDTVEILAPERLRREMVDLLEQALRRHRG